MKFNLMLISKKPVHFEKDDVTKIKHIFLSETNKAFTGWSSTPLPDELLSDTNTFNADRARAYEVEPDEFDGKLRYRVILPQ